MITIAALTALASATVHVESGHFEQAITHRPKAVVFNGAFDKVPSTFAGILSYRGGDAAIPVAQKITKTSAEFFVDEPICSDGNHMKESVDWMALPDGTHMTDEGKPFVVGHTMNNVVQANTKWKEAAGNKGWKHVSFPNTFVGDIAVIATAQSTLQTKRDNKWFNIRVRKVTSDGFQFHVEEDVRKNGLDVHTAVKVSYMAIEIGEGHINNYEYNAIATPRRHLTEKMTKVASGRPGQGYSSLLASGAKPLVFGSVTHSGSDTASLRMKYMNGNIHFMMKEPSKKGNGKCNWDGVHPMAEQAFMILMAPTKFECDAAACQEWDCAKWCRCFDDHEESLYTRAGCEGDDGKPCMC